MSSEMKNKLILSANGIYIWAVVLKFTSAAIVYMPKAILAPQMQHNPCFIITILISSQELKAYATNAIKCVTY